MNGAVERIVVALDAASENRAAIGTAARLAARWKAQLHGVFVEDDDLIRLAHLPFARQVSLGFGVEPLDLQQAERQMRAFAEHARRDLAASAERHGVAWSFEIVRAAAPGPFAAAVGDFLVAATATRPIGRHFRLEARWWAAAEPTPQLRLLAHRSGDPHDVVGVLLRSRGASAERLLAAAIRLAEANDARLAVICAASSTEAAGFKFWLDQRLAGHAVEAEVEIIPEGSRPHRHIAGLQCRLVAIDASAEEAQPDRLRSMVAQLDCDVLIVS